jgi:hypothetical protein
MAVVASDGMLGDVIRWDSRFMIRWDGRFMIRWDVRDALIWDGRGCDQMGW